MESVTLKVEGMACSHCKMAVEKAISSLEGVRDAKVNLDEKKVDVEYESDKVSVEDIKKAVVESGYSVE